MISTNVLGGAAIIGVIAAGWEKLKALFHRFYSVFVITMTVEDQAGYAMAMYLTHQFKRSRIGDVDITGYNEYVRPKQRNQLIALQRISQKATTWWKGGRWLSASRTWSQVKVVFIRGMFNPQQLCIDAVNFFNAQKMTDAEGGNRFFIIREQGTVGETSVVNFGGGGSSKSDGDSGSTTAEDEKDHAGKADKYTSLPLGWTVEQIGQPYKPEAIDVVCLSAEGYAAFEAARYWRESEEWFKARGIPWKLGLMFEGMPGTGKTLLARAMGQTLNMPIFVFDLATMSNKDFVQAWRRMMDWSPCIFFVDDLHAVFNKSENVAKLGDRPGLTFNCLLSMLDGAENSEGVLTIITTNHLETVDPALASGNGRATRPGRIDRIVHFDTLDEAGRHKMAKRILGDLPESTWMPIVDAHPDTTGAQFQDICCQKARVLWSERS